MSPAERVHLFALAQHRLPPLQPGAAGQRSPQLQALLDAVAGPAYARTQLFDVVAWNAANTAMFGDFERIPLGERNVVSLLFTRLYHRRAMPDWEVDARAILAKLRVNLGQAADPAPFRDLIARLEAESPEFHRLWGDHEVRDPGEGASRVILPRHGERRFHHQTLMPEAMPELRIIVYIEAA